MVSNGKVTRTLLITNITNEEAIQGLAEQIKSKYAVKETYTIPTNKSVLFIIFWDYRESERCYRNLKEKNNTVFYTISKYEFPRDQERCDFSKNQGSVYITFRNGLHGDDSKIMNQLAKYGDIKEIKLSNSLTKCLEYYDSRSAMKVYNEMNNTKYENCDVVVRLVWDITPKNRWEIINSTDKILQDSLQSTFHTSGQNNRKTGESLNRDMFDDVFDQFIIKNIDEIIKKI